MGLQPGVADAGASQPGRANPFTWDVSETGKEIGLTYGLEGADSIGLSMHCQRGSGRVQFGYRTDEGRRTHAYGAQWKTKAVLASGSAKRRYAADAEAGELGPYVTARTSSGDPVLAAFGRSGRMTVDGARQDAGGAGDLRHIRSFLARCRPVRR
jgi:hypothetical protein